MRFPFGQLLEGYHSKEVSRAILIHDKVTHYMKFECSTLNVKLALKVSSQNFVINSISDVILLNSKLGRIVSAVGWQSSVLSNFFLCCYNCGSCGLNENPLMLILTWILVIFLCKIAFIISCGSEMCMKVFFFSYPYYSFFF